jgi:sulfate adenylyltransferase subunit 2
MMDHFDMLENKSIDIIREAYDQFRNVAMLWSVGKDSTTLLWLIRKAFQGKIPFPVIHIDTGRKFPEMYQFRDRLAREWGFPLIVGRNEEEIARGMGPQKGLKFDCCAELKTNALRRVIEKYGFEAVFLGTRRDEYGIPTMERPFPSQDERFPWSDENQPAEIGNPFQSFGFEEEPFRVHPLLHFSELEVWGYIRREALPVINLYFSREGKRYRSIGCVPCCSPVDSPAATLDEIIQEVRTVNLPGRPGRTRDKKSVCTMETFRALG